MRNSKQARVLEALTKGSRLTAKQIAFRYRTSNPRAIIGHLRDKLEGTGQSIALNEYTDTKGRVTRKYAITTA